MPILEKILDALGLVTVRGQKATAVYEFARPADANAYLAQDTIAGNTTVGQGVAFLTFPLGRTLGGKGYIVKAKLMTSQAANVARHRLYLFTKQPTMVADNGPYLLLYADRSINIGHIDFPACYTSDGTNGTAAVSLAVPGVANLPLEYECDPASVNLYGILSTLDAFTPASAQTYNITLSAEQD